MGLPLWVNESRDSERECMFLTSCATAPKDPTPGTMRWLIEFKSFGSQVSIDENPNFSSTEITAGALLFVRFRTPVSNSGIFLSPLIQHLLRLTFRHCWMS